MSDKLINEVKRLSAAVEQSNQERDRFKVLARTSTATTRALLVLLENAEHELWKLVKDVDIPEARKLVTTAIKRLKVHDDGLRDLLTYQRIESGDQDG